MHTHRDSSSVTIGKYACFPTSALRSERSDCAYAMESWTGRRTRGARRAKHRRQRYFSSPCVSRFLPVRVFGSVPFALQWALEPLFYSVAKQMTLTLLTFIIITI